MTQWTVGHNLAGYLSEDDDPIVVNSWDDAVEAFTSHVRWYADAHDEELDVDDEDNMRPTVDAFAAALRIEPVTEATEGVSFYTYDAHQRRIAFFVQRVNA